MNDVRTRVAAARRAFRDNPDSAGERAGARFKKPVEALCRGLTELWDRRWLGEPLVSKPRWLPPYRARLGDEGRLAALTAKFQGAPWDKPEGWRSGLKKLGVKTERPPAWLHAPLVGQGRAGEAVRSVLRDEYTSATLGAVTKEYLSGDPVRANRYGDWKGGAGKGAVGSPATLALQGIDPNDMHAMGQLTTKLRKLAVHQGQLQLRSMMGGTLPKGATDPGVVEAGRMALMRADLRREMTGVRGEIAEVSRFLAKHLKIDPSKLGGDPVKLADAADRVTGARKQTAEEFLGKSRTLDKGMAALERQMKAADRNAQSGGEGPDKKKPESKRKRALRFAGRKAAAAMNESIATAMAVAGHLHQATSSMIH